MRKRRVRLLRRLPRPAVAVLLALFATVVVLLVALDPIDTPFTALMIPLLLGALLLGPRHLPWFLAWMTLMLATSLLLQPDLTPRILGAAAIQATMILIVVAVSIRRGALGIGGLAGESMFVDLRDRLLHQGRIPDLPAGWHVEAALASAGGTPFAGDFLVSTRTLDGRLEVVLVDVSGKGEAAGGRALLLSGAFGGLLGAMPPERFLPAANDYLLSLAWEEGFASAVHVSLDLATGRFEIRTAGHPPAVHRAAGSGRWRMLPSAGPLLGLLEDAHHDAVRGCLGEGDAMLLYTDGIVEQRSRDIGLGIDGLLGAAEQHLRRGVGGTAARLVEELGSAFDDRAVVLISRG
mgnify:CR=1 FL=1